MVLVYSRMRVVELRMIEPMSFAASYLIFISNLNISCENSVIYTAINYSIVFLI